MLLFGSNAFKSDMGLPRVIRYSRTLAASSAMSALPPKAEVKLAVNFLAFVTLASIRI
jgi:hypothetical protein